MVQQIVPLGTSTHLPFVSAWVGSEESGAGHALKQSSGGERRIPACVEVGRCGGIELVLPSGSSVEASGGGSELVVPSGGGVDVVLPGGSGVDVVLPRGGSGGDVEAVDGSSELVVPAAVVASMSSFPEAATSMSSFPETAEFTSKSRRRRSRRRRRCRSIENPSASRVRAARPSLLIRLLYAKLRFYPSTSVLRVVLHRDRIGTARYQTLPAVGSGQIQRSGFWYRAVPVPTAVL
jgi:hypothetical protein